MTIRGPVSSRTTTTVAVMTGTDGEGVQPTELDLYDAETDTSGALVCRVCGAVVSRSADYPRVHWAWHEAPNGA